MTLESELVAEAVQIPIYFTTATDNLESLYSDLQKHSHKSEKTGGLSMVFILFTNYFQGLLDSIFSTSYRGFTTGPKATELKNMELINLEGRLTSSRFDVKKPTIVLSAYYDAGGAIPVRVFQMLYIWGVELVLIVCFFSPLHTVPTLTLPVSLFFWKRQGFYLNSLT